MPDLDKYRRVAVDLRKKGGYWGEFPIADLMGWMLHQGRCVYCDAHLADGHHVTNRLGGTDHLLPKTKYPELRDDPLNLVPACGGCNGLKRDWDPNTEVLPVLYNPESGEAIDENAHTQLVSRARERVAAKRKERQANFSKDQAKWADALDQWRMPS
jgi:5-methylcytosine-specific restriction endonuclease McrA